jgi:hypothetical protein
MQCRFRSSASCPTASVEVACTRSARASPLTIGFGIVVAMTVHAMMYGPQAAFIAEQFPTRVRYAGSSLAYTFAGIIGGGIAPLVFAALLKWRESTLWLSMYAALALLVTLGVLGLARGRSVSD